MADKVRTDGSGRELYDWEADPKAGVPKKKERGEHPLAHQTEAQVGEKTTKKKEQDLVAEES